MRKGKHSNPHTRTLFGEKVTPTAEKQDKKNGAKETVTRRAGFDKHGRRVWWGNG